MRHLSDHCEIIVNHIRTEPRLPRSGTATLAADALVQAAQSSVSVITGLSKVLASNYTQ